MTAVQGIWLFLAAYAIAVALLLFIGNQRSLRMRDFLMPSLAALTFRAVAWVAKETCDPWDAAGLGLVVAFLAIAAAGRRVWLVHTTGELLAADVMDACLRVRIVCEQTSHIELKLLLKKQSVKIRIHKLAAGMQLLILPGAADAKFKLLAELLRKRYPRVWPRLTVSLSRCKE